MPFWLGFTTGAIVVTVIFAVWYIFTNKLIDVSIERDSDAANS